MHYTPEDIARAEQQTAADIARLFQDNGYTIKFIRNDYWQATRPDDNRAIGIYNDGAYDYYSGEKTHGMINTVMKYFNMRFPDAVATLLGGKLVRTNTFSQTKTNKAEQRTELRLPKDIGKKSHIKKYLCEKRGLPEDVVLAFEEKGYIFASKFDRFININFLGNDYTGKPAFCCWRGTLGEKYRGNVAGSDKRYPFRWLGNSEKVFVFESPIDLLSYIALSENDNWKEDSYIALSGTDITGLEEFLKRNTKIKEVYACLDNDEAGKEGNENIQKVVSQINADAKVEILVPKAKDWNEDLCNLVKPETEKVSIYDRLADAESRADAHNGSVFNANLSAKTLETNKNDKEI